MLIWRILLYLMVLLQLCCPGGAKCQSAKSSGIKLAFGGLRGRVSQATLGQILIMIWCILLSFLSLRIGITNYKFHLAFGGFPAELGPETRSNGSGSKNGAERTQN